MKIIKPGPHRTKRIRRAFEDPSASVVILVIDSPGGPIRQFVRSIGDAPAHVSPAVKIEV